MILNSIYEEEKLETSLVINKSLTGLMVEQMAILENCNPDKYQHISLYSMRNCTINLGRFPNVKVLYIYGATNVEFKSLPKTLEKIYFRMLNKDVKIPYQESVKSIVNLSSMGEDYIDFTSQYHRYKLDNFDYAPLVRSISRKYSGKADKDMDGEFLIMIKEVLAELGLTHVGLTFNP